MKVLIVRTSSLGDLIHTFPALTDATGVRGDITFDWLVDERFMSVPRWHPAVHDVIPIGLRRGKQSPLALLDFLKHVKTLRNKRYDVIIDAQGLVKSACIARFLGAPVHGYDRNSIKEAWASVAYHHQHSVPWTMHAVDRVRVLFSKALGYSIPETTPQHHIEVTRFDATLSFPKPSLVFIHGTTWASKHWPEGYWHALTKLAIAKGFDVQVPIGISRSERECAESIKKVCPGVTVLPELSIDQMAAVINQAKGVVSVDTGFGHLAAALDVPTVSLYGPTDPRQVGTVGRHQTHLKMDFPCAPCWQRECTFNGVSPDSSARPACFGTLPPEAIWGALLKLL